MCFNLLHCDVVKSSLVKLEYSYDTNLDKYHVSIKTNK